MAKKIVVPTATTRISEDEIYVDLTKLKAEVGNAQAAERGIINSLKDISILLKRAINQKIVKGEKYKKIFTDAASHCNQQATSAAKSNKNLIKKYKADTTIQIQKVLKGKTDELAKQVTKIGK